MMTRSDKQSNTANDDASDRADVQSTDFGRLLTAARKAQNHTIEEVSGYLKIPARTIIALEASDHESLPVATFTQGYIRTYAKFLEIPTDDVLKIYNRAVPHNDVSELKPRSKLPDETNSQSPLIKTITVLLMLGGLAALIYGGIQYYQEKAGVLESELDASKEQRFTGSSLDSPFTKRVQIKQNARITDDGELVLGSSDAVVDLTPTSQKDVVLVNTAKLNNIEQESTSSKRADTENPVQQTSVQQTISTRALPQKKPDTENTAAPSASQPATSELDSIELFVEKDTWISVRDANRTLLLYNTLPAGSTKLFRGAAPFSVNMGNAISTRVMVNGQGIDFADHIWPNNTTKFKVSMQHSNIIFH